MLTWRFLVTSGISSNYTVAKSRSFQVGPWSVYSGKKKTGGDNVSVLVFDKKAFSTSALKSGISKSSLDDVYDRLRREVAALSKIRHPSIVKIIEPLEESKSTMTFVTEPLSACLKNMIGSRSIDNHELDELVIQKGLLQIIEGLMFLHVNAGFVHLDIQPTSVVVDLKGDWKLMGLGLIENFKDASKDYFIAQFDPRLPSFIQINLDYAAPELVLDHRLDPGNDIFSLGCLIIAIYTSHSPLSTNNNSSLYREQLQSIKRSLRNDKLPAYISQALPRLISQAPLERISLEDLKRSEFFDNHLIRTINFLDDFPAKLLAEKRTFLNGLNGILGQFPKGILRRKVLQGLLDELGKEEDLVYLIMKNVFAIGNDMSQLGFSEKILPSIQQVKDYSGCHTAIIENLPVLLSRLNNTEFKEQILPILIKILESSPPESQAELLTKTEIISAKLDFVGLKNDLFPAISTIFGKTTSLTVKLESLKSLSILVGQGLDKYSIVEKLLPLLGAMKTREPKIIMTALDLYSSILDKVDSQVLAKQIVPQLLSLSMESLLSQQQFQHFMNRIRDVLTRIEAEHGKTLANKVTEPEARPSSVNRNDSNNTSNNDDFQSLINGNTKLASDNSTLLIGDSSSILNNGITLNGPSALNSSSINSSSPNNTLLNNSSLNNSSLLSAPLVPIKTSSPTSPTGAIKPLKLEPTKTLDSAFSTTSIDWSAAKSNGKFGAPSSTYSKHTNDFGGFRAGPASPPSSNFSSFKTSTSTSVASTLPKPLSSPPTWTNPPPANSTPVNNQNTSLDQYQSLL